MNFRTVVIKNFKGNIKQYLSYFLCSTFSIMIFFMYATLLFNKEIQETKATELVKLIFPMTMITIVIFSIFFINYAHASFIKGRHKEFGIYMSLGMDALELKNMVNIENGLITGMSLISGIGVGLLFSRIFQLIVLKLLGIDNLHVLIGFQAVLLTIFVFLIIFMIVYFMSSKTMKKMDINGLLQAARQSESKSYQRKDLILGVLGLLIMFTSIILLIIIANNKTLNQNGSVMIAHTLINFIGVYLTIGYGGNMLIHFLKSKRFYVRHMLEITEIHHKYNRNKKIMFIISVLSTMTIFFVASPYSLLRLTESIVETNPYQLEYVETSTKNGISEEKFNEIFADITIKKHEVVPFLFLNKELGESSVEKSEVVVAASDYNNKMNSNVMVNEGEAVFINTDWLPSQENIKVGDTKSFYYGEEVYSYKIINSIKGTWIASIDIFPNKSILVLNDNDYNAIVKKVTSSDTLTRDNVIYSNVGLYHLINFDNWKQSQNNINKLTSVLHDKELPVYSMVESYKSLKQNYSVFLFVTTLMGVLFFISGGSVLYFKQYTELGESKVTFQKLFKIGITDKEIIRTIGNEMKVIFFVPLVFGTFTGCSLIYLMTFLQGGGSIVKEFMKNACFVVLIYFVLQTFFYAITKKKYTFEIMKE